jgi:hypothetical protein
LLKALKHQLASTWDEYGRNYVNMCKDLQIGRQEINSPARETNGFAGRGAIESSQVGRSMGQRS